MPTLADIYSAADSFKRRLADAASNPSGSLQQMLGYANDRARNFNELQQQSLAETRQGGFANQGPATQALNQAYMEAGQVPAMTVFHGSPQIFEKFDLGKLGTGEGAQQYGKGLYMTESPNVAENYKKSLSGRQYLVNDEPVMVVGGQKKWSKDYSKTPSDYESALYTAEEHGGFDNAYKNISKEYKKAVKENDADNADWYSYQLETLKPHLGKKFETKDLGNVYHVDLPDTHIRRMLDWDAPLSQQPYPVRNLAKKLGMDMKDLGGDLVGKIGKGDEGRKILQDAGVPGIKYLGQERGNTGRNFVVFDPNHLTILDRK